MAIVVTTDLREGMRVRLFASHEFRTVADVRPAETRRGAVVTFKDGTSTTIGRGAEWEIEGSPTPSA
jgi:hypothetical protein